MSFESIQLLSHISFWAASTISPVRTDLRQTQPRPPEVARLIDPLIR